MRHFGETRALDGVSLEVREGEIHALLGPNGAGKTTLLRSLTGLVEPSAGTIRLRGIPSDELGYRAYRKLFGFVPSGDRSFYLRISGLENLVFFGRLYGFRKRRALARAWECLRAVGLEDAAGNRVGLYSHGDAEAPVRCSWLADRPGASCSSTRPHTTLTLRVRGECRAWLPTAARRRTAVVWATQRLDGSPGVRTRPGQRPGPMGGCASLGHRPPADGDLGGSQVRPPTREPDGGRSPRSSPGRNEALSSMATVSRDGGLPRQELCLLQDQADPRRSSSATRSPRLTAAGYPTSPQSPAARTARASRARSCTSLLFGRADP